MSTNERLSNALRTSIGHESSFATSSGSDARKNSTRGGRRRGRPGTIRAINRATPRTTKPVQPMETLVVAEVNEPPAIAAEAEEARSPRPPIPSQSDLIASVEQLEVGSAQVHGKALQLQRLLAAADADINQLRQLCWTGIPASERAVCWMILMGIVPTSRSRREAALRKRVQEYSSFVKQHFGDENVDAIFTNEQHKSLNQIDLDMPRTHPGVKIIHLPSLQRSLRRVLAVYSLRHPATGYVQGMNDLATPFFYVFISHAIGTDKDPLEIDDSTLEPQQWIEVEAYSFWCVSRLMEGIQDHYTNGQPGIISKLSYLENLMDRLDPGLNEHFNAEQVQYNFFAYRWINCFLMRELSLPLIVRLWDTYFSEENDEGFKSFHVYVCAAFLESFSDQLKSLDMEHIVWKLQNNPTAGWDRQKLISLLSHAFVLKSQYPLHLKDS